MEKPQSIRNVRLHWESKNTAYQYTLESSTDGNDWSILADHSKNKEPNGLSVDAVKADDARYLKITFRGSNGGGWGSIWEIEAYPGDLPPLPEGVTAGADGAASIDDVKAPEGFEVSLFAGPPQVTYPVASAYDDQHVIDGNATLGDELAEKDFDVVISPIGGGGLISGIVTGLSRNGKAATVVGAEPLLGNDAALSLKAGKIIRNDTEPTTIADGARTISLGNLNWPIIEKGVSRIVEVSEAKIAEAVRLYFGLTNLKSEPTGALSLGAILEDPDGFVGKRVCVVVSGGNVDAEVYRGILAG